MKQGTVYNISPTILCYRPFCPQHSRGHRQLSHEGCVLHVLFCQTSLVCGHQVRTGSGQVILGDSCPGPDLEHSRDSSDQQLEPFLNFHSPWDDRKLEVLGMHNEGWRGEVTSLLGVTWLGSQKDRWWNDLDGLGLCTCITTAEYDGNFLKIWSKNPWKGLSFPTLLENPFLCAEKIWVNMFTAAHTFLADKSKTIQMPISSSRPPPDEEQLHSHPYYCNLESSQVKWS